MSLTSIQRLVSSSYLENPIDAYHSINSVCMFSELSAEADNTTEGRSRALLIAHRDWWTGTLVLEAKKESDLTFLNRLEDFFFGSMRLVNIREVYARIVQDAHKKPISKDIALRLASVGEYLNRKIEKSTAHAHIQRIEQKAFQIVFEPELPLECPSQSCSGGARLHNNAGTKCFLNATIKALWAIPSVSDLLRERKQALEEARKHLPFEERAYYTKVTGIIDHLLEMFQHISGTQDYIDAQYTKTLESLLISLDQSWAQLVGNDQPQDAGEYIHKFLSLLLPESPVQYFAIPENRRNSSLQNDFSWFSVTMPMVPIQLARLSEQGISSAIVEIPITVRNEDSNLTYRLRSVLIHSKQHYYAYVPNYSSYANGICLKWTKHDDSTVQSVRYYDIKEEIERNGYVAIYEKC